MRFIPYDRKTILPPHGSCIYCGRSDGARTTEHPIPNGLGARIELPDASCERCQTIINKEFEQYCLREVFGSLRKQYGIKGNRKRPSRPTTIQGRDHQGRLRKIDAEAGGLPGVIVLPVVPGPNYETGANYTPWTDIDLWMAHIPEETRGFIQDHGLHGFASPGINPAKVCRFLAKIAHGIAIVTLGAEGFEPFLPGIILGTDVRYTQYIGSVPDESLGGDDVEFVICEAVVPARGNERVVLVRIRLFGSTGAPTYRVIAGRVLTPTWQPRPEFAALIAGQ